MLAKSGVSTRGGFAPPGGTCVHPHGPGGAGNCPVRGLVSFEKKIQPQTSAITPNKSRLMGFQYAQELGIVVDRRSLDLVRIDRSHSISRV